MKKLWANSAVVMLTLICTSLYAQDIKTYGVMINVTDFDKANVFYVDQLGLIKTTQDKDYVFLQSGNSHKLILHRVANLLPEQEKETKAGVCFQINNLDSTMLRLKASGISFEGVQKRKEGVGYAIFLADPFGKEISLMHQTIVEAEHFQEPRIYNFGFLVPDMDKAIDFYSGQLGFTQRSRKYLPLDMPMGNPDNTFGFMLHYREGVEPMMHHSPDTEHVVILFKTNDLEAAIKKLRDKGVKFLQKTIQSSALGNYISFYDPFGNLSNLLEIPE
ncbi:MAG: VOC family protein [Bacteroidota bacterium]